MSISQNIKTNRYTKKLKRIGEFVYRKSQMSNPYRIYFPYKTDFIHPVFDELKSKFPIKYTNKNDATLLHLVMGGSKKDVEQNHIVEIIDHTFSIIATYEIFPREPVEYYNRREKIKDLYLNDRLKKIIFISNGQKELTRSYFPQKEIFEKSVVIPIPWADNIEIGKKEKSYSLNFLLIASNFKTKGVEIVLKAWENFKFKDTSKATLTIASHDMPSDVEEKLGNDVNLLKQAPLSNKHKNKLYKNADVVLALTLTDGVTAIEATSYGKPIVTYRTQHSNDFLDNDNGIEIDVPINVYDIDKYGIVWKRKKEFNEITKEYIANGTFNITIDELVKTFTKYTQDRELLHNQTLNAIEKYYKDYTVENRNKKLMEIYDELL